MYKRQLQHVLIREAVVNYHRQAEAAGQLELRVKDGFLLFGVGVRQPVRCV